MLVLSRRINERIVFPTLRTAIQVVSTKPGMVRLGVEAPDNVPVFREEILQRDGATPDDFSLHEELAAAALDALIHRLSNRLNTSTVGLALIHRQLDGGRLGEARATLDRIERDLRALHAEASEAATRKKGRVGLRRRALLVEDDRNERELLAGFLRMAGLEVDTAGDGADALDHLRKGARPDVVLLDMRMPRCDGPSMVRALRQDPKFADLKIFGVTGTDPGKYGLAQGPRGINRWYSKPLDPEALLLSLQEELETEAPAVGG
jgi:carbon storage regulator CsrA